MKIDNWLFEKIFQPLVDWFWDWFGINHITLARIVGVTNLLAWGFGDYLTHQMSALSILFLALTSFFYYEVSMDAERDSGQTVYGLANSYRLIFYNVRIVGLVVGVVCILIWTNKDSLFLYRIAIIAYTSFLYLISCNQKPPQKSKLKKLYEKVSNIFVSGLDPLPA